MTLSKVSADGPTSAEVRVTQRAWPTPCEIDLEPTRRSRFENVPQRRCESASSQHCPLHQDGPILP